MEMYGWGHGAMWAIWPLFLVVIVALLGFLFRGSWSGWRGDEQGGRRPTAREVLDLRFARGELTKEQYEEMKTTLER